MENKSNAGSDAKVGSECAKPNLTNHHEDPNYVHVEEQEQEVEVGGSGIEQAPQPPRQPPRTPFTNLSQVEADLALARTLHEQERAFMMLQMNNEGSDYGSWEGGSYAYDDEDDFDDPHEDTDEDDEEGYDGTNLDDDEDAFDVHAHDMAEEENDPRVEFDPAVFLSDEVYARALQDAEDIEMAARLFVLAGLNDREADIEDHGGYSLTTEVEEDTWEEVDPDELSYEELIALGEVVGTESRGLSADTIASLPSVNYKSGSNQNGNNDSCVICRLDYEDGETLTVLSCKHSYHSECISDWLKINKVCPVCNADVSISGNS
ncbi:hypothetical protein I3842_06G061500 [Carya illinoinensis]|uniref:RING-type domain-containing protein n=1 Tax=Carya illinoinensis TaxID=32201 RepID=A0A922EU00_CARIL|nr:hypothetical protein I3842_06G061500 [Carya illinoinensis]